MKVLLEQVFLGHQYPESAEVEVDKNVLFLLDQLSGQYGTNDYEPGLFDNIPGFPVGILGLITLLGIIVLVRKYR